MEQKLIEIILIAFLAGLLNGIGSNGGAMMLAVLMAGGFAPMVAVFINKLTSLFGGIVSIIKLRKYIEKEKLGKTVLVLIILSVVGSSAYLFLNAKMAAFVFSFLILFIIFKLLKKEQCFKYSNKKYYSGIAGVGLYNGIFGVGMIPMTSSIFKAYRGFDQIKSIANAILLNFLSDLILCSIFIFGFNLLEIKNVIPVILLMIVSLSYGNYVGSSIAIKIKSSILKAIQITTLIMLLFFLFFKFIF